MSDQNTLQLAAFAIDATMQRVTKIPNLTKYIRILWLNEKLYSSRQDMAY